MARVNLGHYLVGLTGLALLRGSLTGPRARAAARVADLERLLQHGDEPPMTLEIDVDEEDVIGGYGRWAGSYDDTPNPLVLQEEIAMRVLLDAVVPGDALDAACGTGRHARHLATRGHRVIGVDASPDMLARARAAAPDVEFRAGDLTALPFADARFDLVVCALALTHCETLTAPVRELARVVRPGGRLVVSDFHPVQLAIGGTAFFIGSDGRAGFVRSFRHDHGAYFAAFRDAGLTVERCIEPVDGEREVMLKAGGMMPFAPDACRQALEGLPGVLIWDLVRPT